MIAFVLLRVFLILLLVAANAFFAAAEFALVSVRDTRIQQLIEARRIGARTVLRLHQHLDEVVNGVQLGITLTSLTLGWIGEPTLARIIEPLLGRVPHAAIYAHSIGIVLTFTLITYLHVILGPSPNRSSISCGSRVASCCACSDRAKCAAERSTLLTNLN
jgi:putative hemolysin